MNVDLIKDISYEEVTAIVKSMNPLKASGPDGLEWVMNCVETVSYSVAVNEKAVSTGSIQGIRIVRGAPCLTHLLFADDCLFFGEATSYGASTIENILDVYSKCSGQLIYYEKLRVFFNSNVVDSNKWDDYQILEVSRTNCPEKYLGMPAIVGRNKKKAIAELVDRFESKINSWSSRQLSMGGKEGWRLLHHPDSLVVRVFHAKYYPSSTFSKATLGANPLLIWRSVWSNRGLLDYGLCWKIGTGNSVSIWNDFWLVHEGKNQSAEEVISFVRSYLTDLNALVGPLQHQNNASEARWLPPVDPFVKINVDSNFLHQMEKACSGSIIRDVFGEIIGANCRVTYLVDSAFVAEALAFFMVSVSRKKWVSGDS
ncbi:uncharacterized protein LOC120177045 [Hibiscus syriacus]|uniref:uncharacterized protein LOC120177045 n=1 Tax=Hibiscus syriacus TaxID=106335 RepID=UPI001923AACD|nr:uncharacterized protein LOC120177045 [Hibiscus syriacus]